MKLFSSKYLGGLPVVLAPACLAALLCITRSDSVPKREDSSHILLIAAAGFLLGSSWASKYYFLLIAILIGIIYKINKDREIEPAPIGVSAFIVYALSPSEVLPISVSIYALSLVAFIWFFATEKRNVATSSIPIASLLMLLFDAKLSSLEAFVVSIAILWLSFQLIRRRTEKKYLETERRSVIDGILVLFSASLLLKSLSIGTHDRYLILALLFGASSFIPYSDKPIFKWLNNKLQIVLRVTVLPQKNSLFTIAAVATATFSALLSIETWPIGADKFNAAEIKMFAIITLAIFVWRLGHKIPSQILQDASKLYAFYAGVTSLDIYSYTYLASISDFDFMLFSLLSYSAIALAVFFSTKDLAYKHGAAWQAVFSGRILVRLRRAKSGAFEILAKAPLIGWMFALAEKALNKLGSAFDETKIWTISHYTICGSVFLGFIITMKVSHHVFLVRIPLIAEVIGAGIDSSNSTEFVLSISDMFAVLLFSSGLYWAGVRLEKSYLRMLSVIIAGLILIALWFYAIMDRHQSVVWYYPTVFCCALALFRLFADLETISQGRRSQ